MRLIDKILPTPGAPEPEDIEGAADDGVNWIVDLMSNPAGARIVTILVLVLIGRVLWKHNIVKVLVFLGLGVVVGSFFF